jgi:hypothetical protein
MISYVNEEGLELASRHNWQQLTNESSFTTQSASNGILSFSGLTGGSGYAGGQSTNYNLVPLTGGHGSGAQATFHITAGVVSSITINNNANGSGYQPGDVLGASNVYLGGTGSGFAITVATVGLVSQENQGSIIALTGPDFNFVSNETMWDRTTRRPIFGPKSPPEWQQLKAQFMQGPWFQYRIRGNQLLFLPAIGFGDLIYFEWVSKYWCTAQGGMPGQTAMVLDTDIGVLDERLTTLGTIWRFKQAKGFPFEDAANKYEAAVADAIGRDKSKARLNLAGAQTDIYPGIVVPAGNWQTGI